MAEITACENFSFKPTILALKTRCITGLTTFMRCWFKPLFESLYCKKQPRGLLLIRLTLMKPDGSTELTQLNLEVIQNTFSGFTAFINCRHH